MLNEYHDLHLKNMQEFCHTPLKNRRPMMRRMTKENTPESTARTMYPMQPMTTQNHLSLFTQIRQVPFLRMQNALPSPACAAVSFLI